MKRRKTIRVVIPTNPEEAIRLALKVMSKHDQDGESSLLRVLEVETFRKSVTTADKENARSGDFRQQSEACVEARNNAVRPRGPMVPGTVRHFLLAARDLLLACHKGHERMLADWGFEIILSPTSETGANEEGKEGDKGGQ